MGPVRFLWALVRGFYSMLRKCSYHSKALDAKLRQACQAVMVRIGSTAGDLLDAAKVFKPLQSLVHKAQASLLEPASLVVAGNMLYRL